MSDRGEELVARYADFGLYTRVYTRARWKYVPFEEMEAQLPKEGAIVDFGCGEGLFVNYLAMTSDKRQALGVDLNDRRLERARYAAKGLENTKYICSDALKVDLPKDLKAATFSDFLHHTPDDFQDKLLKRTADALAPGGRILLKEVPKEWPAWAAWGRFLEFVLYPTDAIAYQTSERWLQKLEAAGLKAHAVDTVLPSFIPSRLYIGVKP